MALGMPGRRRGAGRRTSPGARGARPRARAGAGAV